MATPEEILAARQIERDLDPHSPELVIAKRAHDRLHNGRLSGGESVLKTRDAMLERRISRAHNDLYKERLRRLTQATKDTGDAAFKEALSRWEKRLLVAMSEAESAKGGRLTDSEVARIERRHGRKPERKDFNSAGHSSVAVHDVFDMRVDRDAALAVVAKEAPWAVLHLEPERAPQVSPREAVRAVRAAGTQLHPQNPRPPSVLGARVEKELGAAARAHVDAEVSETKLREIGYASALGVEYELPSRTQVMARLAALEAATAGLTARTKRGPAAPAAPAAVDATQAIELARAAIRAERPHPMRRGLAANEGSPAFYRAVMERAQKDHPQAFERKAR